MSYTYKHPRPALTVDAVVFAAEPGGVYKVLLIRRKKDPFKGRWALPGGFFDLDDASVGAAACRELQEETGLEISPYEMHQLQVFSTPNRDPRERVVSVAHIAVIEGGAPEVKGADDALEAKWIPTTAVQEEMLAFDHYWIFLAGLRALSTRIHGHGNG